MATKNNQVYTGKLHVKKGDTVMVTTGDNKGTSAKVISVLKDKYKVIVEGVNMVSRHTKPNSANPNGGIIKKEAPIHISNVMLIDPKSGKATRIRREKRNDKTVRVAVKSGEVIK
jgi:large subunit ribosomal protein L24